MVSKLEHFSKRSFGYLPLNAKLHPESPSGEFAEGVRDDPEWDKHPNDGDEDAEGHQSEN